MFAGSTAREADHVQSADRSMTRIVSAVALLAIGFLAYIGYIGGEVFTILPASGAPAAAERGLTALFLSSDMGLKLGMGSDLTRRLREDGIAVVGINSLTYFRGRRTPGEADALLRDGIRRARAVPGTQRLILIGQSFGADMLQTTLARLPQPLRSNIAMVVLIVPPDTTMYRASPAALFDFGQAGVPAVDSARRLDWVPVLCIQGRDEDDSLCPHMTTANVTRVALPGGHMLGFDRQRLYAAVAPQIRRVAAR